MTDPAATAAQNLREVRRGVAQAGDQQVLQVVRMVDAMENRGGTDALLEPVRPRLRAIQPARPLRFARLLFMPLDPLIVAPNAWRPGTPFLPRTALLVLARAIRRLIGASGPDQAACLERIDGLIAGATTSQANLVREAGKLLWPLSAVVLCSLGARPDITALLGNSVAEWTAEGLAASELRPTALALGLILSNALALHDHDRDGTELTEQAMLDMLAQAESLGPRAWSMIHSLLVIRVPRSAAMLLAVTPSSPSLRQTAEDAAETALAWVESETADQACGIADTTPLEVGRQVALLEALAGRPGGTAQRRRVAEARAHLLGGCLHRFELSLHDLIATPLNARSAAIGGGDTDIDAIEASARTLRRFELEARRLGDAARFDGLVQKTNHQVAEASALCRMDRARLTEILAGPEAAMRFFAASAEKPPVLPPSAPPNSYAGAGISPTLTTGAGDTSPSRSYRLAGERKVGLCG